MPMGEKSDLDSRIADLRAAGMSDPLIVTRLVLDGWFRDDVERRLRVLVMPGHVRAGRAPSSRRTGHWYIGIATAIVSLCAGMGIIADVWSRPTIVYSIEIPVATTTAALEYGALPALSEPSYYEEVKNRLVIGRASFVDADLARMIISVYLNGSEMLSVPIAAKGKTGSWWETPAGIYKIETREENHFSSFGHVYQPYSLAFQGNFFIHGWPYYEDGTPVAQNYSGGCIRLATEDAKRVFDLARVGFPVIVHGEGLPKDDFKYHIKTPDVSADAYLVADVKNGTILVEKDSGRGVPIASITKLVTGLVATEYLNLDKSAHVPAEALVYTSIPRLRLGKEVRIYDLLHLLLTESSNEAAEMLASALGRETFIRRMNEKARAINMPDTAFTDPSGADEGNISTAKDLFTLLRYIYTDKMFLFKMTAGKVDESAYGPSAFRSTRNFNEIPGLADRLVGGKVGETLAAGKTYAGIFDVRIGNETRELAVIVLGSNDEYADVRTLISFVANTYQPSQAGQSQPVR